MRGIKVVATALVTLALASCGDPKEELAGACMARGGGEKAKTVCECMANSLSQGLEKDFFEKFVDAYVSKIPVKNATNRQKDAIIRAQVQCTLLN